MKLFTKPIMKQHIIAGLLGMLAGAVFAGSFIIAHIIDRAN